MMDWIAIRNEKSFEDALEASENEPVLIFKHSTRCPVSAIALRNLEKNWDQNEMKEVKPYFLDLIQYRDISNAIAARLGVLHESPQVLLIRNKSCFYDNSHMGIDYSEIKRQLFEN